MFERLVKSFGQPANQHDANILQDNELQLAAVKLLFSVLPVDYLVTAKEGTALAASVMRLFGCPLDKSHRMIARAASAHARDSNIMAAATLLKNRTPITFRKRMFAEVNFIIRADGILHENELDLKQRLELLLGLSNESRQKTA